MYGFIVTAVTGDGAAENQAAFKQLGTRTVEELLPNYNDDDDPEINNQINAMIKEHSDTWELRIAFCHLMDSTVIILLWVISLF